MFHIIGKRTYNDVSNEDVAVAAQYPLVGEALCLSGNGYNSKFSGWAEEGIINIIFIVYLIIILKNRSSWKQTMFGTKSAHRHFKSIDQKDF